MRVALTGASGFIGSVLARELAAAGHQVTALVRRTSRRDHIEPFVDRFAVGVQDDPSVWEALLDGADGVVHNSLDWGPLRDGRFDDVLRSNLCGSIDLLAASAPRQFIFMSSIAVHHDVLPRRVDERGVNMVNEDHPLRPGSDYGALKAAVEAYLWAAHYDGGQHTSAVRPCGVYGTDPDLPRSHGYSLLQKIDRGERLSKAGGGKFVHVDDVAAAVVGLLGNAGAAGRPYNLVDCYARWSDWAQMGAEVLGAEVEIDESSPPLPQNMFEKAAAQSIGAGLERGHAGIRAHLAELAERMRAAGELKAER